MPRNITVYFSDGSAHQYNNAPDVLTPDDIERRARQDYPSKKITKIDGGKGNTTSSEINQLKQNAGIQPQENLSQFSIKGLRFGMTLDQVLSVTNAKSPYNNQKTATSFSDALQGFTIAGVEGGSYGWHAVEANGRLVQIRMSSRSENIDSLLNAFSSNYGKPQFHQFKSRTKGGIDLSDYIATWNIQDAVIEMNRHIDRDNGYVSISSKSFKDQEAEKYKQQDQKSRKDF